MELRGKLVFLQFDGAAVRRAGACENFAVIEWRRGFHNAAYETSLPRIDDRHVGAFVIAGVAGQDRQPVAERRRRDDQIGLREGMAALAAVFD